MYDTTNLLIIIIGFCLGTPRLPTVDVQVMCYITMWQVVFCGVPSGTIMVVKNGLSNHDEVV